MGSSSSKSSAYLKESSSSSSVVPRKNRSKGSKVFQSSCLNRSQHSDNDDPEVSDKKTSKDCCEVSCMKEIKSDLNQLSAECHRKVQTEQYNEGECASPDVEHNEWGQPNFPETLSRSDSTSRGFSSRLLNPSGRFLPRFSFFPGNASFRLSRATSLGSSRSYRESSRRLSMSNNEEESQLHHGFHCSLSNRNNSSQGCDLLPACFMNRSSRRERNDFDSHVRHLNSLDNSRNDNVTSREDVATAIHNSLLDFNANMHSHRSHREIECSDIGHGGDRQLGAREPVERNAQFSRTLSVSRLRDRVHRSSFLDITNPLEQHSERRNVNRGIRRQSPGEQSGLPVFDSNSFNSPPSSSFMQSSLVASLCGAQGLGAETSRSRNATYGNLYENRANFLERRRRIRSQVRALQRLGSRFENLSGRERSCILSGQHRTSSCTCRSGTQMGNPNGVNSARASISRIVMLAEALFEVLDEIQQQSAVLSSQPSVSSIGSLPAPNEIVDSLPVKLHNKSRWHINDESAQCYICLLDYEDGDCLRVLPCHHDFHQTCIDKWLKEIHRVCPLCRGDICRSDPPAEN